MCQGKNAKKEKEGRRAKGKPWRGRRSMRPNCGESLRNLK